MDAILLFWVLYLFLNGWNKGALSTLASPLALILGIAASILYLQKTQNSVGFLISLVATPVIFAVVASTVIMAWREKVNKNLPPGLLSRATGAVFNTLWGGAMFVFLLMTIPPLATHIPQLEGVKQRVITSYSYAYFYKRFSHKIPLIKEMEALSVISKDEDQLKQFQSRPEFFAVSQDKKIKTITSDENLMEQIRKKEFLKVLSNPKVQQALQDEELLRKILKLQASVIDRPSPALPSKVYEAK